MKNIHVTAIRHSTDEGLKCEPCDLRFNSLKELEKHRSNLLKVFTVIFYTYTYE